MKTVYLTNDQEAQQAICELQPKLKLCLDTETTGLQAGIAKIRLLQVCEADPTVEDRTVYVFDLFKLNVSTNVLVPVKCCNNKNASASLTYPSSFTSEF